jgi:hypothetical protein
VDSDRLVPAIVAFFKFALTESFYHARNKMASVPITDSAAGGIPSKSQAGATARLAYSLTD